MIIGRSQELKFLSNLYQQPKSSIAVLYGRRRIGKSFLVDQHLINRPYFKFEGIENQSAAYQIQLLAASLVKKLSLPIAPGKIRTWEELLELLTTYIKAQGKKKVIIFFDEYQWMTAGRSKLTSLLKKYWDNDWKKYRVQLILCGSVSSYMLKSVIRSKALYGRIDAELNIEQLQPEDTSRFFKANRSSIEI